MTSCATLIGVIDRQEAVGVALRAGDDLRPVGVGLLLDPRRFAARPRQDVVAVGLGLVAQPLAVGERALHVAERVDDRRRRIDLRQLHLRDLDAGGIGVEDALQQACVSVSILPRPSDSAWAIGVSPTTSRIALSAADFTVASGIADVEQIGSRVLDHPEDGEVDVDDVFVAGQHQRFFGDLPARPRRAPRPCDSRFRSG